MVISHFLKDPCGVRLLMFVKTGHLTLHGTEFWGHKKGQLWLIQATKLYRNQNWSVQSLLMEVLIFTN